MAKITAYDALTEVASGDIIPIVDVSDTTMGANGTNKKVTRATLLRDNLYGWTPAESTWTYASATTFTIAGVDRTSEYRKGGKIRWKQGGTYKYAYILSSAFSTDTTVTITGGSDYTIANSAITDNYASYEVSPLGFPDWFNYTPTITASGSMTISSPEILYAKFKLENLTATLHIGFTSTTGGTASNTLYASLPITQASGYSVPDSWYAVAYVLSAGGRQGGVINLNVTNKAGFLKFDLSDFALGANARGYGNFSYAI